MILTSSNFLNSQILKYIKKGGYEAKETIHGRQYFRFSNPQDKNFPDIIELFARNETKIDLADGQYIIPIKNDEADKLSAILLDEEYFNLIKNNCKKSELGFSIISSLAIICLKARAFRELSERKANGDKHVDTNDIKKHKNDIIRIAQTLDGNSKIELGRQASQDLNMVLKAIKTTDERSIKQIVEVHNTTKSSLTDILRSSFTTTKSL